MVQTLARHSDIRLTLGVYTHVELPDRTAAIEALPVPPGNEQDTAGADGRLCLDDEHRRDGEQSAA